VEVAIGLGRKSFKILPRNFERSIKTSRAKRGIHDQVKQIDAAKVCSFRKPQMCKTTFDGGSMFRATARLITLSLASALVASAQPPSQAANQGPRIHGATPRPVADGSAQFSKHMNPAQMLRLTLTLQPVQQDDLAQFLRDVQDPHSSRFHQFLTFNEWKKHYAPSDASVAMVRGWAQRNGLKVVHEFRNNLAIKVEGDTATIEKAFDVQLNHYTTATRTFYSNDRDPAFPVELTGVLDHVHGLSSYYHAHPANQAPNYAAEDAEPIYTPGPFSSQQNMASHGKGRAQGLLRNKQGQTGGGLTINPNFYPAPGGGYWYEAPDMFTSAAYDLDGLSRFSTCCNPNHNAGGTPKETSIAIIGQGAVAFSDIQTFVDQYGMAYNLTQVQLNSPACCNFEMTMDVEWSTAYSNSFGSLFDTAHVYAYEGAGTKSSTLLDAWNQAQSDDNARNASSSFGFAEPTANSAGIMGDFDNVINAMAATGWTIAVATGDHGATQDCSTLSVGFPASNPNVIAAGGTNIGLNNNAGNAQYVSEHPWGGPGCNGNTGTASNNGGGNGGCSAYEDRGFYQEVFGSDLCSSDPQHPKRALPDVALNSAIGQATYQGSWSGGSGTSIAAPSLAGYFAQVNSYLLLLGNICGAPPFNQACAPLGPANFLIWGQGWAGSISSSTPRNPFYDIKASSPFQAAVDCIGGDKDSNGNQQGLAAPYCAADGYDEATGWGSFNMLRMAWAAAYDLGHGAFPDLNLTGPTTNTWYNTDKTVDFTVTSPVVSGTSAAYGVAGYNAQWDKAVDDTPNPGTPGRGNSYYDGPSNLASSGSLHLAPAGLGCHTAYARGWDRAGLTTDDDTYGPVCFDDQKPYITNCSPLNDPTWHSTDVTVSCLGSDQTNGSGLVNPADANISVSTSVAAGTETASAATGSHQVCDVAGNCNQAGPFSPYKVDKEPPSITITTPTNTQYIIKQPVAANYSCTDGGSGVQSCAGPVASGSNIDTSSIGTKTFMVNAKDNVANASTLSVNYDVTYRICLTYNPNTPFNGSAANITLQLCDYNGVNLSQRSIVVHATAVDGNPALAKSQGNVNPGNNFLYGPPSAPSATYLYVLSTKGLSSGKHVISFTVQGDPVAHSAAFTLK
jgi:hypothetical protein